MLVWNHDACLTRAQRYRVIDAGDGGYRIRSAAPLQLNMTGMVLRILSGLPDHGQSLAQPVQVAWSRPTLDGEHFETGLRRM